MSALPPKADMCGALAHVCFVPKADMCSAKRQVRFIPQSGRSYPAPLMTTLILKNTASRPGYWPHHAAPTGAKTAAPDVDNNGPRLN